MSASSIHHHLPPPASRTTDRPTDPPTPPSNTTHDHSFVRSRSHHLLFYSSTLCSLPASTRHLTWFLSSTSSLTLSPIHAQRTPRLAYANSNYPIPRNQQASARQRQH